MSLQSDLQAETNHYMQLLHQGVPASQAFTQAFPNGLPTPQQVQSAMGSQQSSNAIAQIGGMVAGALGAKGAMNWIAGKPVLGPNISNALGLGDGSQAAADNAYTQAMGAYGSGDAGAGAAAVNAGAIDSGGALSGNVTVPSGMPMEEGVAAQQPGGDIAGAGGGGNAGSTLGSALPWLGVAGVAYGEGSDWYKNQGGKQILAGGGKGSNYFDTALDSNPVTGWANPILDAAGLGSIGSALFGDQLTTRQQEENNTQGLAKMDPNDPAWQNYLVGMRKQNESAPPDPSHPYDNGKYGTFDQYKQGGLSASDLSGAYGNLQTFGPQWAHYSPQQQQAITQGIINAGLYDSKEGDVVITDPNQAKQIAQQILGSTPQRPPQMAGALANPPSMALQRPAQIPPQMNAINGNMGLPPNMQGMVWQAYAKPGGY